MKVGVPKEIKTQEYRVGMVPSGVRALFSSGCEVFIQKGAGLGSGILDEEYEKEGAVILDTMDEIYGVADMIIKVKEPLPPEFPLLKADRIIYTYLHLAPAPELTRALIESGVIAIAYETIQLPDGSLPLLTPMSEVAGRMSIQAGAKALQKEMGGKGVLLGGVPGVPPARVVVLGGGIVGRNATMVAAGMGADVTVIDINLDKLRYIDELYRGRVKTLYSTPMNIEEAIEEADLLVGAVLIPGARAPHLVTREMIRRMIPGSVIVDVAVDQGGCCETTRPTTHDDPIYVEEGAIHYCVANMPGAVARTSTFALTNTTLPYALKIAGMGLKGALEADEPLRRGVNIFRGNVTCRPVAESLSLPWKDLRSLI